jgi:uncharacterized protein YciI
MYALVILRYRRPIEEINTMTEAHRAYIRQLQGKGIVIAAGPFNPRTGGALLVRVHDENAHAALDRIRDEDPFAKSGFANYELLEWNVMAGIEALDKIQ